MKYSVAALITTLAICRGAVATHSIPDIMTVADSDAAIFPVPNAGSGTHPKLRSKPTDADDLIAMRTTKTSGVRGALTLCNGEAGHVLHVTPAAEVLRTEAAAAVLCALNGDKNLEALVPHGTGNQLLTLTTDGLIYNEEEVRGNGSFTIECKFVVGHPLKAYNVVCPATAKDAMCKITCHVSDHECWK